MYNVNLNAYNNNYYYYSTHTHSLRFMVNIVRLFSFSSIFANLDALALPQAVIKCNSSLRMEEAGKQVQILVESGEMIFIFLFPNSSHLMLFSFAAQAGAMDLN